jgi:hypothetical protein
VGLGRGARPGGRHDHGRAGPRPHRPSKYLGKDYGNPIGPQGRVILTAAADKVNTPKSTRR